jgi:hypothetical protein
MSCRRPALRLSRKVVGGSVIVRPKPASRANWMLAALVVDPPKKTHIIPAILPRPPAGGTGV